MAAGDMTPEVNAALKGPVAKLLLKWNGRSASILGPEEKGVLVDLLGSSCICHLYDRSQMND